MSNIDNMTAKFELDDLGNNKELFTKLTLEEGANISGGQGNSGTPVNLKLPDSYMSGQNNVNLSPPPPKKSDPPVDVDDCGKATCVFPSGGNIGLYGSTENGYVGGVAIRF